MEIDRVSIITPVKNGAQFLKECLESIINQTYQNWELLIVNDNSTDETQSILEQYSKKDERIIVFQNKGIGIIEALQTGYSNSSGEFITRMDADDIMDSKKIELLVSKLKAGGKKNVATGLVQYFSETTLGEGYYNYQEWLNYLTRNESNFNDIYKECVIPSPCWMVYKEDFEASGAFNSNLYPEDYDLTFRFYKQGLKVVGVNKVIHFWRDYATRTSRTDSNYSDNYFIDLKIKYWLELDFDTTRKLELWGAGRKGKLVAKLLIKNEVEFDWMSTNKNKIGRDVYGKILLNGNEVSKNGNPQVIVSIGSMENNKEIKKAFVLNKQKPNVDYFFF